MPGTDKTLTLGVIGCGHWGPNHIRVFSQLDRSRVIACADTNPARLQQMQERFPHVEVVADYRRILADKRVGAVVVATPTMTHARICREALQAGKHVLVEKPLCRYCAEGADLPECAAQFGLVLMVGHVFLYNNGIIRLREATAGKEFGRIHYLDAVRTNLGPIRGDVNALYDLGTHDISIFNYMLDATPTEVSALGRCITQRSIEDVCFATLRYPDGTLGHIHVSWLNPRKVRTLTIIGERKMAHWDDVDPIDTLRLYDKGIQEPPHYDSFGAFQCLLRNADVYLPKVDRVEPLINQANAFLDSVLDAKPNRSGGAEALTVVSVLEAATRSVQAGGQMCPVEPPSIRRAASAASARVVPLQAGSRHPHEQDVALMTP